MGAYLDVWQKNVLQSFHYHLTEKHYTKNKVYRNCDDLVDDVLSDNSLSGLHWQGAMPYFINNGGAIRESLERHTGQSYSYGDMHVERPEEFLEILKKEEVKHLFESAGILEGKTNFKLSDRYSNRKTVEEFLLSATADISMDFSYRLEMNEEKREEEFLKTKWICDIEKLIKLDRGNLDRPLVPSDMYDLYYAEKGEKFILVNSPVRTRIVSLNQFKDGQMLSSALFHSPRDEDMVKFSYLLEKGTGYIRPLYNNEAENLLVYSVSDTLKSLKCGNIIMQVRNEPGVTEKQYYLYIAGSDGEKEMLRFHKKEGSVNQYYYEGKDSGFSVSQFEYFLRGTNGYGNKTCISSLKLNEEQVEDIIYKSRKMVHSDTVCLNDLLKKALDNRKEKTQGKEVKIIADLTPEFNEGVKKELKL